MLDTASVRQDFPILQQEINDKPPIYLDNACMSLNPAPVLEAMERYYREFSGCHGRSAHRWSQKTTEEYETAREKVAKFIGADTKEVVFTRNTTEGINLLAHNIMTGWLKLHQANDEKCTVVISDKEHNSNLIPWLQLSERGIINLINIETHPNGMLNLESYHQVLQKLNPSPHTSPLYPKLLVSMNYTSNLDGVTNPVEEIIEIVHRFNGLIHLDGAQAVPHRSVNVGKLDVDFLTFSGHKMLGPTGTGVLYGKKELLEQMEPLNAGGGTVISATPNSYQLLAAPEKFEGGLQDYAGVLGLGAAVDYLTQIGLENIQHHEAQLTRFLQTQLRSLGDQITILGPQDSGGSVTTFVIGRMEPYQIATLLNSNDNIMVRSGQFCVHAWFNKKGVNGAVRASLYLYNTQKEIIKLIESLSRILTL